MKIYKNIEEWFDDSVIWAGNNHTNKSSRKGYIPQLIVNHITDGSLNSTIDWFTSEKNEDSSAHFLISKKGVLYQFVDIEDNAWANGLNDDEIKKSKIPLIKKLKVNPNRVSVSIEHEYYTDDTGLTREQLITTLLLHKYIINFVEKNYNHKIVPSSKTILKHSDIDPKKPHCTGESFPIKQIIEELSGEREQEKTPFKDIKGHWAEELITQGSKEGWLIGYHDRTFRPDNFITRAEMVAIISAIKNQNSTIDISKLKSNGILH